MTVIANNPILPGFYPDPSICAIGEDFYLVNSTFSYFPGIPIFHSKDLAHWEQIGSVMVRNSQLPLEKCEHSEGLFAPTIRYHEGIFYMICTNVSGGGNFIVKATDPAGPWSEPYYLGDEAEGIDPSLFFDEDGTCYYIGTRPNPKGVHYNGDWYIWIQELDLERMKLIGKPHYVWNGSMKQVIWPEGPHLYKKDGYYYLMHAEGGTGYEHCVAICRSKSLFGPYENNPCNPIITHRHLGKEYPIQNVGHADLVQTINGEWFMVMLAVRPSNEYTTLGRETFLAKVDWQNGWPIVNKGVGTLTEKVTIGLPEWKAFEDNTMPKVGQSKQYDFSKQRFTEKLHHSFLMLRNPKKEFYQLDSERGVLRLYLQESTLSICESPSYLGIRQEHKNCTVLTKMIPYSLRENEVAGLAIVQSNQYHVRFEVGKEGIQVIYCIEGKDKVVGEKAWNGKCPEEITLQIEIDNLQASFSYKNKEQEAIVAEHIELKSLSTEVAGGFVGCTVGMYASSQGIESSTYVEYKEFSYIIK